MKRNALGAEAILLLRCCPFAVQGCFDSRPFSELMRSQGLEPELQELLLHAVLLLDHAQQAQQGEAGRAAAAAAAALPIREGSSAGMPAAAAAAAATDAAEPVNLPSAAGASSEGEQQREGAGSGQQQQAGPITAAAALDLLRVYMQSVGRYGQDTGPFLTPMYGCGELPQVGSISAGFIFGFGSRLISFSSMDWLDGLGSQAPGSAVTEKRGEDPGIRDAAAACACSHCLWRCSSGLFTQVFFC